MPEFTSHVILLFVTMCLYVATGDSLARLVRHGNSWEVTHSLWGSGAQCVALDPQDARTVYVGSSGEGIWKSSDGGTRWRNLSLPQGYVFSLAVSPLDGAVYAGCEPSRLFRSAENERAWEELEALHLIPSAPTWSFPPRPWTSHVRWIAPCPHDAELLLVGIELGGVMYSDDSGATWSDHRPDAQPDVHALAWHPKIAGRAYEAGGGGPAWSRDGGWSWQRVAAGLERHYTWGLAIDPDDADCWFISASPGPREAHNPNYHADAAIYRWRGSGPWQALTNGLPQPLDAFPYALTIVDGQLFAGLADGRIYCSEDKGDSWELLKLSGELLTGVRATVGGSW